MEIHKLKKIFLIKIEDNLVILEVSSKIKMNIISNNFFNFFSRYLRSQVAMSEQLTLLTSKNFSKYTEEHNVMKHFYKMQVSSVCLGELII